jgi:hypothetical protein
MPWWRADRATPIRPSCTTVPAPSWPSASASCRAPMDPIMDSALSFAASKPTTRLPVAATRSGAASRCGCCRRPRPSPRTCPRPSAPRWRSSRRKRIGHACRFRTTPSQSVPSATPAFQPCHRADRVQRGGLDGLPEASGAGAVRVRGQRHRHLGEDADGLDGAEASPGAVTSIISTPTASTWQRLRTGGARGRSTAAHAPPDLPAPAHHARDGPCRHRLRDRVAFVRRIDRGRGDRSAAALGRDRAGIRVDDAGEVLAQYEASAPGASPRPRTPTVARA